MPQPADAPAHGTRLLHAVVGFIVRPQPRTFSLEQSQAALRARRQERYRPSLLEQRAADLAFLTGRTIVLAPPNPGRGRPN